MDVEGILENQSDELLEIDLRCLEEELDTGGYAKQYVAHCKRLISKIRNRKMAGAKIVERNDGAQEEGDTREGSASMIREVPLDQLSPFSQPPAAAKSAAEATDDLLWGCVLDARRGSQQQSDLRNLLHGKRALGEQFVEAHIGEMTHEELSVFLECRHFSESFLDRYFTVLDPGKIARFQLFSEEFFINHFSEMNPTIVLKQGKNPWRKKDARSKKLDTFLRIKGVRF